MAKETLTGSRIRERRVITGLRQADLARQIGISASYLNLIEHNRRRIGGKLLLDIAAILGVEPSALTEGAEAALLATLREIGTEAGLAGFEVARVEDLAGRFPAWAGVMSAAHRRIRSLERTVETLSDRLAHDPQLAASMHEVLSTAAAIRSTASILARETDISADWQAKFHGNIDQDSRRLADSAKALVSYLEANPDETGHASPQEEVDNFLEANGYSFPELEAAAQKGRAEAVDLDAMIAEAPQLASMAARHLARGVLVQGMNDAQRVDLGSLQQKVDVAGIDPVALAADFGVSVAMILRRLAALPEAGCGLVVCDRAGSLIFRKPIDGFDIPRFGACCALWPLYDALSAPGAVLRRLTRQVGRTSAQFECIALAEPVAQVAYNATPLLHATMLIVPQPTGAEGQAVGAEMMVGATCRVCAQTACPGRREPSILTDGF